MDRFVCNNKYCPIKIFIVEKEIYADSEENKEAKCCPYCGIAHLKYISEE